MSDKDCMEAMDIREMGLGENEGQEFHEGEIE